LVIFSMHQGEDFSSHTETVRLLDGRLVQLRPIRPEDAPLLQEGFARLSPQSIYMRFLKTAVALSDSQARQLASVDYDEHMALVGSVIEDGVEHLVAVARYGAIPGDVTGLAEAAIIVRDDYQGAGLGKMLMKRLLQYGRQHGVHMLVATVHSSNNRILRFIIKSGLPFEKKMLEPGVWEYRIRLEP
jgi:RimJ/RimL family protein N-acetyltransferase